MSRFQILRIGLHAHGRGEGKLADTELPVMSKEEYLTAIFRSERHFKYGKFNYTFFPFFGESGTLRDGFIFGRLGRDETRKLKGPSRIHFQQRDYELGNDMFLAVNVKEASRGSGSGDVGQSITFEADKLNVNFEKLLASIFRQANRQLRNETETSNWTNVWRPEFSYYANQTSFRDFLKNNISDIRRLDFVFNEPNAGDDLSDELKDFFKELQQSSNSDIIELGIVTSALGFNLSSGPLDGLIDYASRGGGEIIARASKRRAIYRTADKEHRLVFEDEPSNDDTLNEIQAESFRASIINNIRRYRDG